MTAEHLLIAGGIAGFFIGRVAWSRGAGCFMLALVPVATIVLIAIGQGGGASSTGLEYVFVPMYPSLTAMLGFGIGRFVFPARKDH